MEREDRTDLTQGTMYINYLTRKRTLFPRRFSFLFLISSRLSMRHFDHDAAVILGVCPVPTVISVLLRHDYITIILKF